MKIFKKKKQQQQMPKLWSSFDKFEKQAKRKKNIYIQQRQTSFETAAEKRS